MTATYADRLAFLASFYRHRWGYRFRTRDALQRFQQRAITRFLRRVASCASFYGERDLSAFEALPIVDKAQMLSGFASFNTRSIPLESARTVAVAAEHSRDFAPTLAGDISVGCSSGTSGRPGLFLVSARERAVWAGAVLARVLTRRSFLRILNPCAPRLRIAFFLRANSNLYESLNGRRVSLRYFDLAMPLETHIENLNELAPDVLVAPASILGYLSVRQGAGTLRIRPAQIISVAETLEAKEEKQIASVWSPVQQVYQCTEGVLGFSCPSGSLHLNEECVYFEPQWLDEERTRFSAVITDFSRSTQLFVRFRMDDVLRVDPKPCPCGRQSIRLESIEGRQDEVLWLPSVRGGMLAPLFPDQVRRAIMMADGCDDYRIVQDAMILRLAVRGSDTGPATVARIERAVAELCGNHGMYVPQFVTVAWPTDSPDAKRRRIKCAARPTALMISA